MGAVETDIAKSEHWFAGEDRSLEYLVNDSAGADLDMGAFALTWELKDSLDSDAALITKTVGSGITVANGTGTNDKATVAVDDVDTEGLDGSYFHILRRTDAGSESVLSFGKVRITSLGLTA